MSDLWGWKFILGNANQTQPNSFKKDFCEVIEQSQDVNLERNGVEDQVDKSKHDLSSYKM